jgi:hypothetical protein
MKNSIAVPPPGPSADAASRPRPRRWRKALLIAGGVFVGLVVLVLFLGPPIIGSVARSKIQSILAEKLKAEVTVGDVSFGWSGHIEIERLGIKPPGFSRPLLEIEKVDVKLSLASAAGGKYIADVEVVTPKVVVERGADGRFNYEPPPAPAAAPGPAEPAPPSEPALAEKPFVQATLKVRGGEVRIAGGGRETVFSDVAVDAKVDTLQKPVDYELSLANPTHGRLAAKGAFDLDRKSGPVELVLEKISLDNLTGAARAYGTDPGMELAGTMDGRFEYRLQGIPALSGTGRLELAGLGLTRSDPARSLKLARLVLTHEGALDDQGSGRHTVVLAAGEGFSARVVADVVEAMTERRGVKADFRVESDLSVLGTMLPGFGVTGVGLWGKARLEGRGESRGFKSGTCEATFTGSELRVDLGDRPMNLDALTVTLDAKLDEKGAGRQRFAVESGKALRGEIVADVADAFGTANVQADVRLDSDLAALGEVVRKLIDLKADMKLEGTAAVRGKVGATGPPTVAARGGLEATVSDLVALDASGRRFEVDKSIGLTLAGSWDGSAKSVALEAFKLESSFATAEATVGVTLGDPVEIRESAVALGIDLEKLGAKLALFLEQPPAMAGKVDIKAAYTGEQFDVVAGLAGVKVAMEQRSIGPIDARLVQKGTFQARPGGALGIETCTLSSSAVDAEVRGGIRSVMEPAREGDLTLEAAVRPEELSRWVSGLNLGGPEIRLSAALGLKPDILTMTGRTKLDGLTLKDAEGSARTAKTEPLEFSAEMKGKDLVARLKTALFEWADKAYAAKGGLEAEATWGEKGTTGTTRVTALEISDGKNVVKDPSVTLVHDLGLPPGAVEIRKAEVSSSFLRGNLTGEVRGLDKAPEFVGVKGAFRYVPGRLGAVLAPWLGGKLEGAEEKTLEVRLEGSASAAEVLAILRGAQGSLDVDLAKFTNTGLSVSGRTQLALEKGVATSSSPLDLNGGKTEVDARLDFREPGQGPRSTIGLRAKDVRANADMGPMLEKINPIFHTVGGTVDGVAQSNFDLSWEGPLDPTQKEWLPAAGQYLRGSGVLSVQNLSIVGSPSVGEIMTALGEANALSGELLATDIRIGGGRCEYQNMTLRLKRYELRFSGWVGFDKRMELMVEMPLTEHMSRKYGNLEKYVGKTLFVPLKGTVDSPSLDLGRVIEELLKRSLENLIEDKAQDLLDDLFKKKKKKKD